MAPLIAESQRWVDENVGEREIASVQEFVTTAPGPVNRDPRPSGFMEQREYKVRLRCFNANAYLCGTLAPWYTNPQTEAFCAMLGLENKVNPPT
jgi:lariat debranching enzyme